MAVSKNAITKGMILSLSSNQDVYERGLRYYHDGKLLSYNAVEDSGETTVRATIEGNYKNYEVTLKLDTKDALVSYVCSCESHSIWRGACKHVVAVLFAHAEGHARMFSAGKMRQHAHELTNKLEEIIFNGIDEAMAVPTAATGAALVKLMPTVHCTRRGIYLTFTIGRGRSYVIKSISAFVNSCKTSEKVTYGQGLTLVHSPSMFDEASQKLLGFITREDDMYSEVSKRMSRQFQLTHPPLTVSRELHLTQRNIDEFFDMFAGQTLECEAEFGDKIKLLDDMPHFSLNVRHLAAGTVIQADAFEYRIIRGKSSYYVLADGGLYRLTRVDGRILSSLLKAVEGTPNREILMSGNDQRKFLTIILPQLKRMGIIASIAGDAPVGDVSPLITKMYFDSEKKDVTGRVEFHYDSVILNALEDKVFSGLQISRDIVAEYAIRRQLLSLGFYEDKKNNAYRLSGDDFVHSFLHNANDSGVSGIESLRKNAEIFVSENLQKKTIRAGSPTIGLRLSGDLLKVSLEDSGYDIGELLEALEAYRARKKFYRLKDGRFLSLEDESVSAAAGFLDALDVTKKEIRGKTLAIPAYRALYVDELTRSEALANTHALKRDQNLDALLTNFHDSEYLNFKLPHGLNSVLREYQKAGFNWLKTLAHYGFGGILADDMGLGKTLQVISVLASDRKVKQTSIVVCPTSLLFNWENEISRFAPKLKTQVISGMPDKRRDLLKNPDVDVLITTYDMLKRDIEYYKELDFAYIIADEAQNIKNPGTQAAKSLKELKGRVRFALTGTPIENTLSELWSIFDFIMPGYLYTAHKFGTQYEIPIVKFDDAAIAAKLRRQIAPFVLRRVKESVLKELPEKTETILPAELLPEQKKIYQATLLETIGAFDDIIAQNAFADNRMRILAQLTRLRQICCHPGLFLENYGGGSGKLNLAIETIQLALESGHRVLLFSQFTSMLGLIKETLDNSPITVPSGKTAEYFYLDGAIKSKERMEMTERFNAGEREVFLISLKAGGAGLNLTGADVVIHYDPWWNPSVMDQASDRAHRYGQKKSVQVFNLVAKDSIEEKIMSLQEKKRGLIDSVITEGGSFINLLSEEEVRKLFAE
ncbi:MAG: SNF2 family helicase [Firmicutes bacterium]|nr:SNF2 family helicase [Bacillota bacterium]